MHEYSMLNIKYKMNRSKDWRSRDELRSVSLVRLRLRYAIDFAKDAVQLRVAMVPWRKQ